MFLATGNAVGAVIDAVKAHLDTDATLGALVTRIAGHIPANARATYPYLKIGTSTLDDDYGAMQVGGGRVTFALDTWSNAKGPHTVRAILARLLARLERQDLPLAAGFAAVSGSLHCTLSTAYDEPDPDMPEQLLYHGHQEWELDVEEAA